MNNNPKQIQEDVARISTAIDVSPETKTKFVLLLIDIVDLALVFIANPFVRTVLRMVLSFGRDNVGFKNLENKVLEAKAELETVGVKRWQQ